MASREQKFPASEYAEKFEVHVKTILRAVTKNPHASDWDPEPLTVAQVARAFKMDEDFLLKVMKGREHLIDAEKAAGMLDISVRRFHQRRSEKKEPKPVARHGRTVRYALSEIASMSDL